MMSPVSMSWRQERGGRAQDPPPRLTGTPQRVRSMMKPTSFGTGFGSMRRTLWATVLLAGVAAGASAQEPPPETRPPLAPGSPPEWGVEAGYGFSVHLNHGNSAEHLLLFEPSVGLR